MSVKRRDLVKFFETHGFYLLRQGGNHSHPQRLKPYHCPAGKLTIGTGQNLEDKGITEKEALMLLENDIQEWGYNAVVIKFDGG